MKEELSMLLIEALKKPMSNTEKESQRRSYAYGSGALGRDSGITRASVDLAATKLQTDTAERTADE